MKTKLAMITSVFILSLASASTYAFDSMKQNYTHEDMSQNVKKIEQVNKLDKLNRLDKDFYDKNKAYKQAKSQKRLYLITEKEAKEIALNHERFKNINDVVVRDIDLEHKTIFKNNTHMKKPFYDIELLKDSIEYEVHIDAQTGEVLKIKQDDD